MNTEAVGPAAKPTGKRGLFGWIFGRTVDAVILVAALVNLAFVFFDYTYVDFRPYYQSHPIDVQLAGKRYHWDLVALYDPIKGIDPHRATRAYLEAARETLDKVQSSPDDNGIILALNDMQAQSAALIKNEDTFTISGQRGVLERIKHAASNHMMARAGDPAILGISGAADVAGARKEFHEHSTMALQTFWTTENLAGNHYESERAWFERELAPLIDRAYYRHYGENGKYKDDFKRIDLAFALIFLIELAGRIIWELGLARDRSKSFKQSWQEFIAIRWVDFIYFLPLALYWLPPSLQGPLQLVRMFSVGFRMQRLGLINPVAVVQAKVEDVLELITDMVNVKLLSNYQQGVQDFDLEQSMKTLTPQQRQQITLLIQRNLTMILKDVLPEIAPHIEKLALRAASQAMEQAPAYQQLRRLPIFGALPERMLPNLIAEVLAGTQVTMLRAINDAENLKLTNEMIDALTASLLEHMATIGTEQEIKNMVIDMLEEQKRKVLAD